MKLTSNYLYFGLNVLLLCESAFFFINNLQSHTFPITGILMLSLACLFAVTGMMRSDIKQNDERMKTIRQKSMTYSFLGLCVYIIAFIIALAFFNIMIDPLLLLEILCSLTIITTAVSMFIVSRQY